MTLHVKDGGTWKEASELHAKDGGTWKQVTNGYVKDGGSWKEFLAPSAPAYSYAIAASSLSGGKTIDGSFTLNPVSGGEVIWSISVAGSSPPGFWFGNTSITTGEPATVRSISADASSGTLVTINYQVTATVDGTSSVEPATVSFLHQF